MENLKNFDHEQTNTNTFLLILQLENLFTKTHEMIFLKDPTPLCTLRFVKLVEIKQQKEMVQKKKIENKKNKQVYKKQVYRYI